MTQAFPVGLAMIRTRFLQVLNTQLMQISQAAEQIHANPPEPAGLVTIRDIAHRISGTAGTLGFAELGAQAAATEDLIRAKGVDPNSIDDVLSDEIDRFVRAVEKQVSAAD